MSTPPDIIDRYRKLRALADHPNTDGATQRAARTRCGKIEADYPTVNLEAFPEPTRPSHGSSVSPVDLDAILRTVFGFGRTVKDFFAEVDDVIAKASVTAQARALIEENMEADESEEQETIGKGRNKQIIDVAVFEYTIPLDVLAAVEKLGPEAIAEAARTAGELFEKHVVDVLTGVDDAED